MTSKEALEELRCVLTTNPGTKRYSDIFEENLLQPIEKDLKVLENVKNILDNSFNKTYEETMNDIYGVFNKYNNEKARLENDK